MEALQVGAAGLVGAVQVCKTYLVGCAETLVVRPPQLAVEVKVVVLD